MSGKSDKSEKSVPSEFDEIDDENPDTILRTIVDFRLCNKHGAMVPFEAISSYIDRSELTLYGAILSPLPKEWKQMFNDSVTTVNQTQNLTVDEIDKSSARIYSRKDHKAVATAAFASVGGGGGGGGVGHDNEIDVGLQMQTDGGGFDDSAGFIGNSTDDKDSHITSALLQSANKLEPFDHRNIQTGDLVDGYCPRTLRWYESKILECKTDENGDELVKLHFQGWHNRYDEWISRFSERIVGHGTSKIIMMRAAEAAMDLVPWFDHENLVKKVKTKLGATAAPKREKVAVAINGIDDWCVDYSYGNPTLWLVSTAGIWYRVAGILSPNGYRGSPTFDYFAFYKSAWEKYVCASHVIMCLLDFIPTEPKLPLTALVEEVADRTKNSISEVVILQNYEFLVEQISALEKPESWGIKFEFASCAFIQQLRKEGSQFITSGGIQGIISMAAGSNNSVIAKRRKSLAIKYVESENKVLESMKCKRKREEEKPPPPPLPPPPPEEEKKKEDKLIFNGVPLEEIKAFKMKSRNPMDDKEYWLMQVRLGFPNKPFPISSSSKLMVPDDSAGVFLSVWSFLATFKNVLNIPQISLDIFRSYLMTSSPSNNKSGGGSSNISSKFLSSDNEKCFLHPFLSELFVILISFVLSDNKRWPSMIYADQKHMTRKILVGKKEVVVNRLSLPKFPLTEAPVGETETVTAEETEIGKKFDKLALNQYLRSGHMMWVEMLKLLIIEEKRFVMNKLFDPFDECLKIIDVLMNNENATPFLRPVDPLQEGVPHYWNLVSKPIDLGTIKDRIKSGWYFEDLPAALKKSSSISGLNQASSYQLNDVVDVYCEDFKTWFPGKIMQVKEEESLNQDTSAMAMSNSSEITNITLLAELDGWGKFNRVWLNSDSPMIRKGNDVSSNPNLRHEIPENLLQKIVALSQISEKNKISAKTMEDTSSSSSSMAVTSDVDGSILEHFVFVDKAPINDDSHRGGIFGVISDVRQIWTNCSLFMEGSGHQFLENARVCSELFESMIGSRVIRKLNNNDIDLDEKTSKKDAAKFKDIVTYLDANEFFSLNFEGKVNVLQFLCDLCLKSNSFREAVETLLELEAEKKRLDLTLNKEKSGEDALKSGDAPFGDIVVADDAMIADESALLPAPLPKTLKSNVSLDSKLVVLGRDRDFRIYYYVPSDTCMRVFVEAVKFTDANAELDSLAKHKSVESIGPLLISSKRSWNVFTGLDSINTLYNWLSSKGLREIKIKRKLEQWIESKGLALRPAENAIEKKMKKALEKQIQEGATEIRLSKKLFLGHQNNDNKTNSNSSNNSSSGSSSSKDSKEEKSIKSDDTMMIQETRNSVHSLEATANGVVFYDESKCYYCQLGDNEDKILLCDQLNCNKEFHMYCLTPPLKEVPEGEWICPECFKEKEKKENPFLPSNLNCSKCGKIFSTALGLKIHVGQNFCMKLGSDPSAFCPKCGKSFTTKQGLKIHLGQNRCVASDHLVRRNNEEEDDDEENPLNSSPDTSKAKMKADVKTKSAGGGSIGGVGGAPSLDDLEDWAANLSDMDEVTSNLPKSVSKECALLPCLQNDLSHSNDEIMEHTKFWLSQVTIESTEVAFASNMPRMFFKAIDLTEFRQLGIVVKETNGRVYVTKFKYSASPTNSNRQGSASKLSGIRIGDQILFVGNSVVKSISAIQSEMKLLLSGSESSSSSSKLIISAVVLRRSNVLKNREFTELLLGDQTHPETLEAQTLEDANLEVNFLKSLSENKDDSDEPSAAISDYVDYLESFCDQDHIPSHLLGLIFDISTITSHIYLVPWCWIDNWRENFLAKLFSLITQSQLIGFNVTENIRSICSLLVNYLLEFESLMLVQGNAFNSEWSESGERSNWLFNLKESSTFPAISLCLLFLIENIQWNDYLWACSPVVISNKVTKDQVQGPSPPLYYFGEGHKAMSDFLSCNDKFWGDNSAILTSKSSAISCTQTSVKYFLNGNKNKSSLCMPFAQVEFTVDSVGASSSALVAISSPFKSKSSNNSNEMNVDASSTSDLDVNHSPDDCAEATTENSAPLFHVNEIAQSLISILMRNPLYLSLPAISEKTSIGRPSNSAKSEKQEESANRILEGTLKMKIKDRQYKTFSDFEADLDRFRDAMFRDHSNDSHTIHLIFTEISKIYSSKYFQKAISYADSCTYEMYLHRDQMNENRSYCNEEIYKNTLSSKLKINTILASPCWKPGIFNLIRSSLMDNLSQYKGINLGSNAKQHVYSVDISSMSQEDFYCNYTMFTDVFKSCTNHCKRASSYSVKSDKDAAKSVVLPLHLLNNNFVVQQQIVDNSLQNLVIKYGVEHGYNISVIVPKEKYLLGDTPAKQTDESQLFFNTGCVTGLKSCFNADILLPHWKPIRIRWSGSGSDKEKLSDTTTPLEKSSPLLASKSNFVNPWEIYKVKRHQRLL